MIVDCYFNVRRRLFSLRHKGKVIAHDDFVVLRRAKFIVSEPGRQRVLASGHKNVHAYVRGEKADFYDILPYHSPQGYVEFGYFREAYYNPRKTEAFIDKATNKPLDNADFVILWAGQIFYHKE